MKNITNTKKETKWYFQNFFIRFSHRTWRKTRRSQNHKKYIHFVLFYIDCNKPLFLFFFRGFRGWKKTINKPFLQFNFKADYRRNGFYKFKSQLMKVKSRGVKCFFKHTWVRLINEFCIIIISILKRSTFFGLKHSVKATYRGLNLQLKQTLLCFLCKRV